MCARADAVFNAGDPDFRTESPVAAGSVVDFLVDFVAAAETPATVYDLRRTGPAQRAVDPPSTERAAPVMKEDSSLARNRIDRAISSGFAARPIGIRAESRR